VVTNWSIDLQGDVAFVESYGMGIDQGAMIDGKPTFLLAVGRNLDRFEKRDGEWRIAHRTMLYDWYQDWGVSIDWAQGVMGLPLSQQWFSGRANGDHSAKFFS
jgi:hypothetical protein